MAIMPSADRILSKHLALYYFSSPGFRPFQLISYMFLHGGFTHLFFNMFALIMFGRTIEMVMGSSRFLFYYITCGICAALVQLGVYALCVSNIESILPVDVCNSVINEGWDLIQRGYNYTDPDCARLNIFVNSPMVGASGAIYGVLLAFGFLFPNVTIYLLPIPFPVKAKWLIVGYFVIELLMGMSGRADNIAHFAHLGGMIFGFLLLYYWKKKGVFNNRWFF